MEINILDVSEYFLEEFFFVGFSKPGEKEVDG